MQHDAVLAETIGIRGHGDDEIEAYTARPMDGTPRGGMIVIHHMPGYDAATKEITRRFATMGYHAICPNLYTREAPGAAPDDAAATARAQGGVPDERFVGDAAGAARWLRSLPTSNGRVGAIGFCSGGRQAVLAGIEVDLQAAIDCYGAFVVGAPPEGFPLQVSPFGRPHRRAARAAARPVRQRGRAPLPRRRSTSSRSCSRTHGKTYEFHRYDDAGHAFFSVDRPSYRVAAAVDGWERIRDFLARHLAPGVSRMCTYSTEKLALATSSGKGPDGWFPLETATVYYDHPVHAPDEHTVNIDFLNPGRGPGRPGRGGAEPRLGEGAARRPRGHGGARRRPLGPPAPPRAPCADDSRDISLTCRDRTMKEERHDVPTRRPASAGTRENAGTARTDTGATAPTAASGVATAGSPARRCSVETRAIPASGSAAGSGAAPSAGRASAAPGASEAPVADRVVASAVRAASAARAAAAGDDARAVTSARRSSRCSPRSRCTATRSSRRSPSAPAGPGAPAPGSVYPTVSQLADEGLVRTEKAEGRSVIHLTDAGRTYVDEHREELDAVWNTAAAEDGFGALRESVGLAMGAVAQVAQVGREEQVTEAVRLLDDTRRRLYLLLAGEPRRASRPPRAATPTRAGATTGTAG